jgi:hypothetical protein
MTETVKRIVDRPEHVGTEILVTKFRTKGGA